MTTNLPPAYWAAQCRAELKAARERDESRATCHEPHESQRETASEERDHE